MTASLFGLRPPNVLPVTSGMITEQFTPYASQTVFNLTTFTYVQGTNSVMVFVNGLKKEVGEDYLESSTSQVTLLTPVGMSDDVEILGFPVTSVTVVDNTIYHEFPFYMANGDANNIPLNSSGELPFFKADGLPSNIPII